MPIYLSSTSDAAIILQAPPQTTLAQAIWLSGAVSPKALCSGIGRCAKCRVYLYPAPDPTPAEHEILSEEELSHGLRLACRHTLADLAPNTHASFTPHNFEQHKASHSADKTVKNTQEIIALDDAAHTPPPLRITPYADVPEGAASDMDIFLAIDIGTTSICWQSVTRQGNILQQGSVLNPQMGAGADIMSRIAFGQAKHGARALQYALYTAVVQILDTMPVLPTMICLAANTAITAFFLGQTTHSLAKAPYSVPCAGHVIAHIDGIPPIYIPPQPAPFVGGDLSAGMAHLLASPQLRYPFMLADMGTNGEFILGISPEHSLVTSIPLGPALEGIGLSLGDIAGPGVVTDFRLGAGGLNCTTYDMSQAQRICGAGYLSLLRILLRTGVLTTDGQLNASPPTPLGKKIAANIYTHHGMQHLRLPSNLFISWQDIEEILKVKAAFSLAFAFLLQQGGIVASQLQAVYLAGALGEHVQPGVLEQLGFLPRGTGSLINTVGNSSLRGATQLLLHPYMRTGIQQWSARCSMFDATVIPDFTTHYIRHMRFE